VMDDVFTLGSWSCSSLCWETTGMDRGGSGGSVRTLFASGGGAGGEDGFCPGQSRGV